MIKPKPFKYKCPKCRYSKVVKPKSDALSLVEMSNICPKCKAGMKREELSRISKLFTEVFK